MIAQACEYTKTTDFYALKGEIYCMQIISQSYF